MEQKKRTTLDKATTIGGGLLGALGTYALLRKGKTPTSAMMANARKHGLGKVIDAKAPKSSIMKGIDRALHGVDELHYAGGRIPKKPSRTKATVIHTQSFTPDYVKGRHELGSMKSPTIQKVYDRKDLEMRLLDQIEPNRPKTLYPNTKFKGEQGLKKLQQEFADKKNFFLKPNQSADTGVGGVGFVTAKDLAAINYSKKGLAKIDPEKRKMVREFLKNPKNFTVQADMGIKKDITGANKEFRVHAFGEKVVPGASSPRGSNITGALTGEQGKAERYLQKVLNKLPSEYRKIPIAADVAKTNKGFKIVELNLGPAESGFLDPSHMRSRGGLAGMFASTKANQAIYKAMTGRASKLEAGTKAVGAGAGTVGAIEMLKKEDSR